MTLKIKDAIDGGGENAAEGDSAGEKVCLQGARSAVIGRSVVEGSLSRLSLSVCAKNASMF